MNTFDRHLLREWLQILALVLVATCGLLLVQVCYDDFQRLREAGARGWELWRYVLVTMPGFLAVVLPLALLVSLLFTLTKLHRANEFTAMRAAGVGFFRLMRPVWLAGVLACGVAWWLNSEVVPWSVEQSREQRDELEFLKEAKTLPPDRVGAVFDVAFDNPEDHRVWFLDRFSRYTHRGYGVSVSELDSRRRETRRLVASEAWFDPSGGGWVFSAGRVLTFDVESGETLSSEPFAEKRMPSFHEDPELMLLSSYRPIDLSFFELRRLVAHFGATGNPKGVPYAVRFYSLMADTLGPLIVIAMAIPFAIAGVRVNPAVGVSKSIGLFFIYYVLENIAGAMAAKQVVDPALAAWLPNVGMAGLAAWFFARLR